jgi:hypothetical protein
LNATAPDLERRQGVRPQIRIGLNAGAAVVGKMEDRGYNLDTTHGDTVNFATRLQALAEPDTVLMSEAMHRLVHGMVDETFVGEHPIKGKADLQRMYRLDSRRIHLEVAHGFETTADPLIQTPKPFGRVNCARFFTIRRRFMNASTGSLIRNSSFVMISREECYFGKQSVDWGC